MSNDKQKIKKIKGAYHEGTKQEWAGIWIIARPDNTKRNRRVVSADL